MFSYFGNNLTAEKYMNKFEQLYDKIISEYFNAISCNDHSFLKGLNYPKNEFFDEFSLINETVKAAELTPVPDLVLREIIKNLSKINNSIYKISYAEIENIVDNSEYFLSEVFLKNLKKYAKDETGNLYIIFIDDIDQDLSNIYDNKTIQLLKTKISSDDRVFDFYSELANNSNTNGLTIIKKFIEIEDYKDCLIFINKNNKHWKDTLEHEFTHFIQRICSFDKDLPKTYEVVNIKDITPGIQKVLKHFDKKYHWKLFQHLYHKIFLKEEQHQTIKSMIKFFIRQYEQSDIKTIINHKEYTNKQIEEMFNSNKINKDILIKHRLTFLHKFILTDLSSVHDEIDLNTQFLAIYEVIKEDFPQYHIDNIIDNEFKAFRFRDI